MCDAARAELLLPHAPEMSRAGSSLDAWSQAAELTLWVTLGDEYGGLKPNHEPTQRHQRVVGGLAYAMVTAMDMSGDDQRMGLALTMAGWFHDTGKGRPEILEIVDLPTKYTPAQVQIMKAHAQWGAEDFAAFAEERLLDPSLGEGSILFKLVENLISYHHDYGGRLRVPGFNFDTRRLRAAVGVLQAADILEAILTPVGREYRLQRLVGEGFATLESRFGCDDVLVPRVDAISRHVGGKIGVNSLGQLARGGVTMRDLVALGVELMSSGDPERIPQTSVRGGQAARRHIIPSLVPRLAGSLDP